MTRFKTPHWVPCIRWLSAALLAVCAMSARADSAGSRAAQLPLYQQECASCHLAFPPGLLPAASWQHLMGTLSRHFGTDASLDEASQRELSAWLKTNAGTYKRVSEAPAEDRISKSVWFLRKHRAGEVPADAWKRASVGSPSNCAACHRGAAAGNFSEHEVQIPR
jgi:mono/diheme cytochrome c family protein